MSRRGKNQVNCNDSEEHIKECYGMGKYMGSSRKNVQEMQAVLDASPDVIHVLDSNGIIIFSNEGFAKRMGLKLDNIIGKNVFDYFPGELALKRKSAVDTVFTTGKPLQFEDEGPIGIFESHIYPIFNQVGEVSAVAVYARDITERKKAEEALIESKRRAEDEKAWSEGILESIGDAISIQDPDFKILYQNERHKNLMGNHVGEYCYKAYENEDDVCEGCPVASAFEDGGTHLSQRVVPGINVEIMASVLRDHAGKIVAGIEVVRDIEERKKMEELHIENQSLALADKTKSEFLSIMSHELRTPLNSCIGFSDLLRRGTAGKLNAKQEKFVDNILNSSKHLLELINDILDISSIEAGKMKLDIEKISLPDFIEENLFFLNVLATERKVAFKKDVAPETGVIECDKQRLRQILFNLVDNAIKFSKEEGGIVTITARKDRDMVTISVSDTGIGIKEDDIGKLFKNFTQLDTGYSRKYGGTGLGLAVTSKLVELHGGDIWVESKYGEGSTFTFTLPIKVKV